MIPAIHEDDVKGVFPFIEEYNPIRSLDDLSRHWSSHCPRIACRQTVSGVIKFLQPGFGTLFSPFRIRKLSDSLRHIADHLNLPDAAEVRLAIRHAWHTPGRRLGFGRCRLSGGWRCRND